MSRSRAHRRLDGDFACAPPPNNWSRCRGEFADEVHIEWRSRGRPMFMIEFWTDQTERITRRDPRAWSERSGAEYYARLPVAGPGRGHPEIWYGQDMTFDETLAFATQHLAALDEYLRTGTADVYIDLCALPAVWRERPPELFPNPPSPPLSAGEERRRKAYAALLEKHARGRREFFAVGCGSAGRAKRGGPWRALCGGSSPC